MTVPSTPELSPRGREGAPEDDLEGMGFLAHLDQLRKGADVVAFPARASN